MIDLYVEPRVTKTWDRFRTENPPFSIALDGYVKDRPLFDQKGPYLNCNHHEFVDRLSTRSTTAQVHMAIKQGLFQRFSQSGKPTAHIYVNDPDYDVCVAWWLLKNHERITGTRNEPLISRLVSITDYMDATGGLYPLDPHSKLMRQRAWIFEPYTESRLTGRLPVMEKREMQNIIDAVIKRIDDHLLGHGEERTVDTRYERIGGGDNWTMVREIGAEARGKMVSDGIYAFVSVRDGGNEHFVYTLARTSPYIDFPVLELIDQINEEDGFTPDDPNAGGGSDIIGGTSRGNMTKITPQRLERIINDFLAERKNKR